MNVHHVGQPSKARVVDALVALWQKGRMGEMGARPTLAALMDMERREDAAAYVAAAIRARQRSRYLLAALLDAQAQEIEALDQLRAAIIAGHPKARE